MLRCSSRVPSKPGAVSLGGFFNNLLTSAVTSSKSSARGGPGKLLLLLLLLLSVAFMLLPTLPCGKHSRVLRKVA